MPCPGNHEVEFGNGPQGLTSYLTRYTLPDNSVPGFRGRWYSFRIGSVLFVSLDADDVIYQDAAAFVAGPAPLAPRAATGNAAIPPGTSFYIRGYSGGAQTRWLRRTLADGQAPTPRSTGSSPQMHQCAARPRPPATAPTSASGRTWLPLFDRYEVDLVLCGHDHDYERSFPVRGTTPGRAPRRATGAPCNTRPHPVTTADTGVFDTSQGTVHLILGGGGTNANLDDYGCSRQGRRCARPRCSPARTGPSPRPPGVYAGPARTRWRTPPGRRARPVTGYGIAVFDVNPAPAGGQTSITVTHYHAVGADPVNPKTGTKGAPTPDYTAVRDVHPGPPPLRRAAPAREAVRGRGRQVRRHPGWGTLAGAGREATLRSE